MPAGIRRLDQPLISKGRPTLTTVQDRPEQIVATGRRNEPEGPEIKPEELERFADDVQRLTINISRVVVAGGDTVKLVLLGLFSEGHILLEDLPGVGKTPLAKSLATSIDCEFKRIQFTPDLMPSDITGTTLVDMQAARFDFIPGPIFANIVLADEINRTGPRTQAALLEAMGERQVSVEGDVRHLPAPFLVIATQNMAESHGTFPLPDSQLDRFLIAMNMGMPSRDDETEILLRSQRGIPTAETIISGDRVRDMQCTTSKVDVALPVRQYIVDIVATTRTAEGVEYGVSPRGGAALQRASQTWAAMSKRNYVVPEDIQAVAPHVTAHRLIMSPAADRSAAEVIEKVLQSTEIPA